MSYVQLLSQVPVFARLAREDLERLSALVRRRDFARGELVFQQGDEGTALYVVRRGEVAIRLGSSDGREVTLSLMGRGQAFGELALLDGEARSADAVAREPSQLLVLQREDFLALLRERPLMAEALLAELSRTVRRVTATVQGAAFLGGRARLARALLELARTQGELQPGGVLLGPRLTQTELARLVGATRESVNKWLRAYEREGVLRKERGRVVLLSPERLRGEIP